MIVTRMETRCGQSAHNAIEEKGPMKVTRGDGKIFWIMPGGEFDGECWVHPVVESKDAPIQ